MKLSLKTLEAFDDGLYSPEVGRWSVDKYRILMQYNNMFATGMKKKWDRRLYIDLFRYEPKNMSLYHLVFFSKHIP